MTNSTHTAGFFVFTTNQQPYSPNDSFLTTHSHQSSTTYTLFSQLMILKRLYVTRWSWYKGFIA